MAFPYQPGYPTGVQAPMMNPVSTNFRTIFLNILSETAFQNKTKTFFFLSPGLKSHGGYTVYVTHPTKPGTSAIFHKLSYWLYQKVPYRLLAII